MKKILVVMDGGNIQDIIGIPEDVQVIVRDFDLDNLSREELLDEIFDENLRFMEPRPIGATLLMSSAVLCLEHTWAHNKDEMVESRPATEDDLP